MYKMIIADDEEIIREGLMKLVNWEELGFEIIKILENGEEVIDFLESEPVDVVLTDIMMPHISGIDIAKYIQQNELNCKVVIISGYKKFELAHQAIRYGVEDFILKPSGINEVTSVFKKIRKALDINALDLENRQKVENQWKEMQPVLREKFIHSLILGGTIEERKDIERRMHLLYPEINSWNSPCLIATIKIENYETYLQNKWNYSAEQFENAILNFVKLSHDNGLFHVVYSAKNRIRIFAIMKVHGNNFDENVAICSNGMAQLERQFEEIFDLNVSLDIEQVFDHIYQVIDKRAEIMINQQDGASLQLTEQKKLLMTNVMIGNMLTAKKIMDSILQSYAEEDIQIQHHLVVDILSDICKFLQVNRPKLYQDILPYIDYQIIGSMTEISEMIRYCERIFELMNMKGQAEEFDQNGLVDRIKKYVSDHIYEDIMQDDVANEVFITSTHIRRIFKKQTGETFLQYITRKKMEKAVELLRDPKYKVYQVGEVLGYKTPRYFSKLFRNFTGYYPNQYRNEVLKLGETADEKEEI